MATPGFLREQNEDSTDWSFGIVTAVTGDWVVAGNLGGESRGEKISIRGYGPDIFQAIAARLQSFMRGNSQQDVKSCPVTKPHANVCSEYDNSVRAVGCLAYAVCADFRLFGNRNPTAISHTKLGKRTSGIRSSSFGNAISSQLSSPATASTRPNTTTHRGRRMNPAALSALTSFEFFDALSGDSLNEEQASAQVLDLARKLLAGA
jgi:hypothetical protein